MMIQDTKRYNMKHVKASTWIPEDEMEQINRLKGDISTSLWIKRAIRKALSEGEDSTHTPRAANSYSNATTPQGRNPKEVEAV